MHDGSDTDKFIKWIFASRKNRFFIVTVIVLVLIFAYVLSKIESETSDRFIEKLGDILSITAIPRLLLILYKTIDKTNSLLEKKKNE